MIREIKDIKRMRKRIGLTQSELAKFAGVSQSLIAKIEAGTMDPTYSNAIRIFDALMQFSKKEEVKARDIMQKKVISVKPGQPIVEGIKHMKKYGISQLPVIEHGQILGFVTDSILLEQALIDKKKSVRDIMMPPPPVISIDTSIKVISSILKHYPFVMVSRPDLILGIITKADVLSSI